MNDKVKLPGGVTSAAHIKEDANKQLPETDAEKAKPALTLEDKDPSTQAKVPPSVVQEDNIPSNDHGAADPRNNEISEYDESLKNAALAEAPVTITGAESGEVIYSSHPIANYKVGQRFKFENSVLRLSKAKDIEDFQKVLDDLPESERMKIRKLDVAGAERISRDVRAAGGPLTTKQTDSSTGDRGPKPQLGKGDLKDSPNGGAVE